MLQYLIHVGYIVIYGYGYGYGYMIYSFNLHNVYSTGRVYLCRVSDISIRLDKF